MLYKKLNQSLPFIMTVPALLWQTFFLGIPVFVITLYSFLNRDAGVYHGTLQNYASLFSPLYAQIILNSVVLSLITTGLCLLIAYPVAYYLATRAGKYKNILLVFLILPSWTSFIIQVYSWFYLLQKNGLFSRLLEWLKITKEPINMLNTYGATILGMVYCFLPFMIFPLYSVLDKMDKRLLEASSDLGATTWQTFRYIIFPLSASGIKVGCLLVLIPAFGEFAVPDLMGGFKEMYVGRVVMEKFLLYRNWFSGAAVVMMTIVLPLLVLTLVYGGYKMWEWNQQLLADKKRKEEEHEYNA